AEWGIEVFLRVMSAPERVEWAEFVANDPDAAKLNAAALLVRCLCDQDGRRLFTDAIEDVKAVAAKSFRIIDRLANAALKHNAIGDQDADAKKNDSSAAQPP